MAYVDLSDFLDDNDLVVDIGPHQYRIPSPSADDGLRMSAMASLAMKAASGGQVTEADARSLRLEGEDERAFVAVVLSQGVVDQMTADGLAWSVLVRTANYAFAHFAVSPESARKAFESGAFSGKAPVPTNRAARRAGQGQSGRQASTAGKKTPTRTAAASRGTRSTSSGSSSN